MEAKGKIKVVECIRQGQIGGGESHLLSLVEHLDRSVFDPVVLSFTDGPMIDRLNEMKIENHVIHTTKPFDIRKWGTVKKFLKKQNADIIHAHGTRANSNVLWAARSLGIPLAYTVHGWSFHQDQHPVVRRIRIMGERYLTNHSQQNISVSRSNQQSGKKFLPSFESIVINNGIDQKKFNPARELRDIRSELKIDPSTILVLFVARFTSHKQPLSLIHAFKKALAAFPGMHLLMVGDGDQKNEAQGIIAGAGLQDKITLWPFRQDVPDVLAAGDIFVLPSLWEGLPIGLLEAMAMGKAVIGTNVDGTSEVISPEKNGILIETEGLIDNLAAALVRLGSNPALRETFSLGAIETIKERYNASSMTREIESVYRRLLKNTPKDKNRQYGI